MINNKNRIYVFFIICIGVRIFLSIVSKNINIKYLPILGYIALIPAIGFLIIFITGSRKTGFEAGGKIWWNHMRPIHSILFFIFAKLAINMDKNAWIVLLLDALLGIISKVIHIYQI